MDITLDLSEEEAHALAADLSNAGWDFVAEQIVQHFPKPRIPEPSKWGVVAARKAVGDTSYRFVSWGGTWVDSQGDAYSWDGLIDPILIREGI